MFVARNLALRRKGCKPRRSDEISPLFQAFSNTPIPFVFRADTIKRCWELHHLGGEQRPRFGFLLRNHCRERSFCCNTF